MTAAKDPQNRQTRPPPRDQARRAAFIFGLRAETQATVWLRLKGYSILARRYLGSGGEIDIIAVRRDVIAFVEVKARPTIDEAMLSITAEKARRMSRAAPPLARAQPPRKRQGLARRRHFPRALAHAAPRAGLYKP